VLAALATRNSRLAPLHSSFSWRGIVRQRSFPCAHERSTSLVDPKNAETAFAVTDRTMTARPKESPEVLAMLKKLDDAMIGCAPTSHMFSGDNGRLRELPIASTLGSTSALRDRKRESVQDVLDKFGAAAAAGRSMDKEALASSLRFAVDNDSVGPGAAAAARTLERSSKGPPRQQLGASTLAPDDVSALADDRGHLPLDAEVRKLSRHYLSGTAGPAASTLYRSFADTSTLGQGKAPLRDTVDITLRAAGAAPHWQGTYAGEFKFTDEVRLPAGQQRSLRGVSGPRCCLAAVAVLWDAAPSLPCDRATGAHPTCRPCMGACLASFKRCSIIALATLLLPLPVPVHMPSSLADALSCERARLHSCAEGG